jgi:hypothetical protein
MTQMSGPEAIAKFRADAQAATDVADALERAEAAGIETGFIDFGPTMERRLAALGQELAVAETARLAAEARADRFEATAKQRQNEALTLRRVLAGIRRDTDPEALPVEFPADGTVLNIVGWWKPGADPDGLAGGEQYIKAAFDSREAAARRGFLPLWAPAG